MYQIIIIINVLEILYFVKYSLFELFCIKNNIYFHCNSLKLYSCDTKLNFAHYYLSLCHMIFQNL